MTGQNCKAINPKLTTNMTTDRQREIRKRINLNSYLKQLSAFAGRDVRAEELTSLEFMEKYRRDVEAIPKTPNIKLELSFEARKSPRFYSFIDQLRNLNHNPVYLWTSLSNDCGLLQLSGVSKVDFAFPFEITPEGVLVISTADGKDRMLLDFSEEIPGNQSLEIELRGLNWIRATKCCNQRG